MILSKRLTTIASLVPAGSRVADVGTDHGYTPIYLVKNGIAVSAIAMDVRKGPLSRAAEHVQEYGLEDKIQLRLSDGLDELRAGEADAVIISGLGGPLMIDMLTRGHEVAQTVDTFVLSPQSDIPGVRVYLREHGYRIDKELFFKDEGKYYTVMVVTHGESQPVRYIDDLFGKELLDSADPTLKEYLEKEQARYRQLIPSLESASREETRQRGEKMKVELSYIEEALAVMEEA